MTPELAKKLLPIITAFANGETIQMQTINGTWQEYDTYDFSPRINYRIKPKVPEYRLYEYTDKYMSGPVVAVTRNCKFSSNPADIAIKHNNVRNGSGRWLTDWLPIPNYNE